MALRTIREFGDEVLNKKAKPVKAMTPKLQELINDMFETMYDKGGVGLAAPQVGILKRLFVIDVDYETPYVFINPKILDLEGEQTGEEGCLSLPGKAAQVTRANVVRVRALNENMEEFELTGEGLLARAIQHEYDHLEGVLYTEHAEGPVFDMTAPQEDEEFEA